MKQILLTLVFLFGISQAYAQRFTEFSVTGTKWYSNSHYENFMFGNSDYRNTTICYTLGTDTVINGQTWKKFYHDTTYYGAIREQNGQVWYYPNEENIHIFGIENGTSIMLYDFNLQTGDNLFYSHLPGFTKEKKTDYDSSIKVLNVYETQGRKVIDFGREQWIEGVGSVKSPFLDRWEPSPTNGSSSWETLYQMESKGKTLFFNGEIARTDITTWMQEGMTWTQNWDYDNEEKGLFRQIVLKEEVRPGTFTIGRTDTDYWILFDHLQDFNGKVYAIGNGRIELCYDFTVQEGDTVTILGAHWYADPLSPSKQYFRYDTCTVSKVDSVEINKTIRKRIYIKGQREDTWIEGIGSLTRIFPTDREDIGGGILFNPSRITCMCMNEEVLYLHPDFADCTTSRTNSILQPISGNANVKVVGQSISCLSPTASLLEVYTLDAMKVGQSSFHNGEAVVTVPKTSATYLYIVTHPDGRRESGKMMGD